MRRTSPVRRTEIFLIRLVDFMESSWGVCRRFRRQPQECTPTEFPHISKIAYARIAARCAIMGRMAIPGEPGRSPPLPVEAGRQPPCDGPACQIALYTISTAMATSITITETVPITPTGKSRAPVFGYK